MRKLTRAVVAVVLGLVLVSCGGGDEEADAIASRTPRGTQEAQDALERFLGQPFISDEQAEEGREMIWQACATLQDGGTWEEVEATEIAASEEAGRPLSDLEISGMRTAAAMGISAYCPQHEGKTP